MAVLTLRILTSPGSNTKNAPLTISEVDNNFISINDEVALARSEVIADARISGSYTGLINLTGSGTVDFARFLGNTADTAAAPSFSFTSDTNTGIWSAGEDQLGFTTGGTNRLTISTSLITSALPVLSNAGFIGFLSGTAEQAV